MPRGGDFCFVFSTRGPEFFTEKLSWGGILMEKISVPWGQPGGMVTSQIDTCITDRFSNRRGYLANMIFCHLLNVKFPFKHVSRNLAVLIQI